MNFIDLGQNKFAFTVNVNNEKKKSNSQVILLWAYGWDFSSKFKVIDWKHFSDSDFKLLKTIYQIVFYNYNRVK